MALTAPKPGGDHHVTQTLARCSRRSFAGCGRVGTNLRFRVGRLAWRLAPWMASWRMGLGRTPLRRRRPRLLRLRLRWRRLLCTPSCAHPMGTALAPGQPLLLTSRPQRPARAPAQIWLGALGCRNQPVSHSSGLHHLVHNRAAPETIIIFVTCSRMINSNHAAELAMNSRITGRYEPIDRQTCRSICDAVGERLQQQLRPETSGLSGTLQHLVEELRRRDRFEPR